MLRRYVMGREFESRGGIITFYFFFYLLRFLSHVSLYYLPLIQFNVSFRDYLYMLTVRILYFHAITGLSHTHALCMN